MREVKKSLDANTEKVEKALDNWGNKVAKKNGERADVEEHVCNMKLKLKNVQQNRAQMLELLEAISRPELSKTKKN